MEGVCREVESTLFRRRPKAVVMECGGRQVKVYLHARVRNLTVGERLRFYVADATLSTKKMIPLCWADTWQWR